jgi:hypothetical protein
MALAGEGVEQVLDKDQLRLARLAAAVAMERVCLYAARRL